MKIEEICKKFNISKQTWYNWQKTKPELIKLIKLGLESENGGITINGNNNNTNNIIGHYNKIFINNQDICKEICEEIKTLNKDSQKKLFHKFMSIILDEKDKNV